MSKKISLTLRIWRQKNRSTPGKFEVYKTQGVDADISFIQMLNLLNEKLAKEGRDPIDFDHDCQEGCYGKCGAVINGQPFGPVRGKSLCQLHMHNFKDGETLIVEPFRASAFPIIKDLSVDRSAFDRILASGGFESVKTVEKIVDSDSCISCGACVAACPNASAMLFVAAKSAQLNLNLLSMVKQMDQEKFGNCSNSYECEAACPRKISVELIANMNKAYAQACQKS